MAKTANDTQFRVSNTQDGSFNRKDEWISTTDDDGKPVYTVNIRITVENPPADYELPKTLEASQVSQWAEAKHEKGEKFQHSNGQYRLDSESVTEFEADDDKPHAISGVYRTSGLRFSGLPA